MLAGAGCGCCGAGAALGWQGEAGTRGPRSTDAVPGSPGRYHQGEHALWLTAGEMFFHFFLFLFAFITLASVQDKWI